MKNPSSFSRKTYIEELSAHVAEPPIGKNMTDLAAHLQILREYGAREFEDYPIATAMTTGSTFSLNKSIYSHRAYNDLFFEISFLQIDRPLDEPLPDDSELDDVYDFSKPNVSVYDFAQSKFLVGLQNDKTMLKAMPMSLTVKKRLFNDYGLNAFPLMPFDTIDELMLQVPTDSKILEHGDDFEPKNNHQKERSEWLYNYVDQMFAVKASDGLTDYAVPKFNNPHVICLKPSTRGDYNSHDMILCDLRNGHVLDVQSTLFPGTIAERREYSITERSYNDEEKIRVKNALFLIEKNAILRPDTVLDLGITDIAKGILPDNIDVSEISVLKPQ